MKTLPTKSSSYTKSLLEEIEERFNELNSADELEEENVTGNIEGYNIPSVFGGLPDKDTIEVFDYKQTKKSNVHFKPLKEESTFKKFSKEIHQLSPLTESKYDEVKFDKSVAPKKKINLAIADVHRKLYEIELIVNRHSKLKTELTQVDEIYWKSTKEKLLKLSERLIRVSDQIKSL